jgi:hypothetical protein
LPSQRRIDRELVTRKVTLILPDLQALEPFARKDLASYLTSATDEVLVERYLERIIGRMIDINYRPGRGPPARPGGTGGLLRRPPEPDRPRVRRAGSSAGPRGAPERTFPRI